MAKTALTIRVKGIGALNRRFAVLPAALKKAGIQELNMIGEEIMTESKSVYVPVDTGALRSTGIVVHASDNSMVVKLFYGGRSAPYAVHVHETQKNYKSGKQWKYLETPVKNKAGSIGKDVGDAIVDAAKRLGV